MIAIACAAGVVPAAAAAHAAEPVAESMFLCDPLPPGGRELSLSAAVTPDPGDRATGAYSAAPRLQLAYALGARIGFTADVGLGANGAPLEAPAASLKLLLRAPGDGRTGVALSADLAAVPRAPRQSELGLGLGAIRAIGAVTLRAGATLATPVGVPAPHLHAGASTAVPAGDRVHLLAEIVADVAAGAASWGAGPSVKVALARDATIAVGVLFSLAGAPPSFAVQLATAL